MRLRTRDVQYNPKGPARSRRNPTTPSALLALPDVLLSEVLSWSADSATANALLSSCRAAHQLCHDPAARALLLMRCPCSDYDAALASCGCLCGGDGGGAAAVVQQLLQLMHAIPASVAPPRLLQALLHLACSQGDPAMLRSLLALPQPPDLAAGRDGGSTALELALLEDSHLAALRAQPASNPGSPPCEGRAPYSPRRLASLNLLLLHFPPAARAAAVAAAVLSALSFSSLPALDFFLPSVRVGDPGAEWMCGVGAVFGSAEALQRVLDHHPPSAHDLCMGLVKAAKFGHVACAEMLLDRGAEVNRQYRCADGEDVTPLLLAIRGVQATAVDAAGTMERLAVWEDMCRLLMRRGAVSTPAIEAALQSHLGGAAAGAVEHAGGAAAAE